MELEYYINNELYYYGVKISESDICEFFKVDTDQAKRLLPYIDTTTLAQDSDFKNYMTERYHDKGIEYIRSVWKVK